MRIIEKLQQGGGIPPFVSFTSIPQSTPAAPYTAAGSAAQTEDTSKNGLSMLSESMVKALYEKGIPVDVDNFVDRLSSFSNSLMSNPFKKTDSTLAYKTALKMLPRLLSESNALDDAYKNAVEHDGMGEIAVTDNGYVYTIGEEGKIEKRNINTVDFNKEQVLTNSELVQYRRYNPTAAFDSNIAGVLNNAIGITKITDYIKSVIDKLGTTSMSREGYVGQQSGKLLKGIEFLTAVQPSREDLSGMSLDGLYKVVSSDKSQQAQAKEAINYLMGSLPKNMRTVLQAKAAENLGDNSIDGVKKLLITLTNSALNGEHSFTLDYKSDLEADGSKKLEAKDAKGIMDPAKAFLLGRGEIKDYTINAGTEYSMILPGNSAPITTTGGQTLGTTTLDKVAKSSFSGVLDMKNATMGGNLLTSPQQSRVVVDGSNVVSIDLPIDIEAKQKGIIRPDMDSLKRLSQAERYIKENNITNNSEINKIYLQYNLPMKYVNGQVNVSDYARFAVLDGSADESAFPDDPTMNGTVREINDINERESIERVLKQADKTFKMSQPGIFFGGNNVYAGSVYIPVRENFINASLGSGHYTTLKGNDANEIQALEDQKQRLQTYNKTPSISVLQ